MKSLLLLPTLLLIVACGEEPTFATLSPRQRRERDVVSASRATDADLRRFAGADALDCGVAQGTSADRVSLCATRSLKERRPFYCRYEPALPPRDADVLGTSSSWRVAYAGTSQGALLSVFVDFNGRVGAYPLLSPDARDPKPLRLWPGMTPPRMRAAPDPVVTGEREISGIVLVETIIDRSGAVGEVRVLKALPRGIDTIAKDLVKRTTFEPASQFGVTLPVFYNVTVNVDQGVVGLRQ